MTDACGCSLGELAYCTGLGKRSHDIAYVGLRGIVPHDPDTPHLASQGSQPSRYLDVVLLREVGGHCACIHALGDFDNIDGDESLLGLLHVQVEASRLQLSPQKLHAVMVALPE